MNHDNSWIENLLGGDIILEEGIHQNDDNIEIDGLESKWQVIQPSFENTYLTIDQAATSAWCTASKELDCIEKSLLALCSKSEMRNITEDDIIEVFFGPKGVFRPIILEHIGMEDENFYPFMSRFCLLSMMGCENSNAEKMLSTLKVDMDKVMSEKTFNRVFQKMSDASTNYTDAPSSRRPKFLWEKLQSGLNMIFKELLVTNRQGSISTVIDDDKVWCNSTGNNSEDRKKIKYTVHVRDNRRGFNIHTFATFFNFFPLHLIVEEEGVSSTSALKKGINYLFGSSDSDFQVGGDRGYFGGGPSIKTICQEGGEIIGTTKKGRDTPFTTGKLLDRNDRRIVLQQSGAPSLYIAESKISGRKVTATAFRTGSGSVSNAISTTHHGHWWDAQSVEGWNRSPYPSEFFKRLDLTRHGNIEMAEKALEELQNEEVTVITIEQGRACWHLLRKWSMTSHPSSKAIQCMFRYFWRESEHKDDWKSIARKLYGEDWQHGNNSLVPLEERDGVIVLNGDTELQSLLAFASTWSGNEELILIKNLVHTDSTIAESVAVSKLRKQSSSERKTLIDNLMSRIPEHHRVQGNQKDCLKLFYTKKNHLRKWVFYKKDFLLATASKFKLPRSKCASNTSIWTELSKCQERVMSPPSQQFEQIKEAGIKYLLQMAFHSPLTGSKKSDCEMGHRNEPKIIKTFIDLLEKGTDQHGRAIQIPGLKDIIGIYTTGLVEKKTQPYVKDSIDFIAVVLTQDDEVECWGGEVKTRTRNSTKQKEINYQSSRFNNQAIPPLISSFHFENIHNNVQNIGERSQLLHHAYTYNFQKIIFLIGDVHCNIIHGDVMFVSDLDKDEYGNMLTDIFNELLLWAYPEEFFENENFDSDPKEIDIPNVVLEMSKKISEIGDESVVFSTYNLWLTAYIHIKRYGPMQPLHRIIPMQHAWWNVVKPGGDTITQLIESNCCKHPHINFETRASSRLLQYGLVTVHRLFQLTSARRDTYHSLHQYRHCASKRNSFFNTMLKCFNYFRSPAHELPRMITPPRPPPRRCHRNLYRTPEGKRFKAAESLITTPSTCLTPKKKSRQLSGGDDPFNRRHRLCKGPPVLLKIEYGRQCWICKRKTKWMCQGCHLFVCHASTCSLDVADDNDRRVFCLTDPMFPTENNRKLFFLETCFLSSHPSLYLENNDS